MNQEILKCMKKIEPGDFIVWAPYRGCIKYGKVLYFTLSGNEVVEEYNPHTGASLGKTVVKSNGDILNVKLKTQ